MCLLTNKSCLIERNKRTRKKREKGGEKKEMRRDEENIISN